MFRTPGPCQVSGLKGILHRLESDEKAKRGSTGRAPSRGLRSHTGSETCAACLLILTGAKLIATGTADSLETGRWAAEICVTHAPNRVPCMKNLIAPSRESHGPRASSTSQYPGLFESRAGGRAQSRGKQLGKGCDGNRRKKKIKVPPVGSGAFCP